MAEITLSGITIPTPQPYAKNDPTRNTENFYYAMLQILSAIQSAGFKFGDIEKATKDGVDIAAAIDGISLSVSPTDLTAVIQALQDLQHTGVLVDTGHVKITQYGLMDTV